VPDLPGALTAIDEHEFTTEPRAWRWHAGHRRPGEHRVQRLAPSSDFPGQPSAVVAVRAAGHPFVSYAADAVVGGHPDRVQPPTASRPAGPIVQPLGRGNCWSPPAAHALGLQPLAWSCRCTNSLALEIPAAEPASSPSRSTGRSART